MKLWIRSQDGILLEKAEAIKIANYDGTIGIVINNDYVFGEYKTKERAIEVLDEIQNILKKDKFEDERFCCDKLTKAMVYQMPEN
jgi:hypothetical protein